MSCPSIDSFRKLLLGIDQAAEIKKDKENPLRYDVWSTTSKHVKDMINNLSTAELPDSGSVSIMDKLERTFKRIINESVTAETFVSDIVDDKNNIQMSLALHELMESVKGESDKARKYGIDAGTGLPNVPLARLAASIGRKILFQQGFRIANSSEVRVEPKEVEQMYYAAGMVALELLQGKGYVTFNSGNTIKDYIPEGDINKARRDTNVLVSGVKAVALNTSKLGVKEGSEEEVYFTNRQEADIADTRLGTIVNMLSAVRQITQPSKYLPPDKKQTMSDEDYEAVDAHDIFLDETSDKVRKQLYKHNLKVNGAVHDFLNILHQEVKRSGLPASKIIKRELDSRPEIVRSLFGLKQVEAFSVDKLESTAGQNLSKATALDDIAEYYDLLMENDKPANVHMPLKVGRNQRLYYLNSVLNPHASKQSRHMISTGTQSIKTGSNNFKFLVHAVGTALDSSLTYKDIIEGSNETLEKALEAFDTYNSSEGFVNKVNRLVDIAKVYPGLDYVTLSTALQAVKDIRNPTKGVIKTEYAVSADATASGGTLTFFQALATNPNVKKFLESLGMFPDDEGNITANTSDIYSLMTDALSDFLNPETAETAASDLSVDGKDVKGILQDTLNLLFNEGSNAREFSKSPTMTFVYGQGKAGAINSITEDLADRIMDTLDQPETRMYLSKLFNDSSFIELPLEEIIAIRGLYPDIRQALVDSKLPAQLHALLGSAIKEKYLAEYQARSVRVFDLVKQVMGNEVIKILPAGAVLDGKEAVKDLAEYGMPIAKVFEIMHTLPNGDQVLTRQQLLHKTIMDVSAIHGIDSALLYHAIDAANLTEGVVVIHDEVRGSVEAVLAVQKAYALKAQEVLQKYDIHEQMLEALKVYHPEVVNNQKFKLLEAEIKETVEQKKKFSESFNTDTSALIGDGDAHLKFAEGAPTNTSAVENETTTAKDFLKTLGKESSLIKLFLNVFDTKVKNSDEFSYDPSRDEISINPNSANIEASIEAVEHEIIHAATLAQLVNANNGTGDKASIADFKYFQKTISELESKMSKTSEEAQDRIRYILSQPTSERQVAEFVAIMFSEKQVALDIYALIQGNAVKNRLRRFIERVRLYLENLSPADFDKDVDVTKLYGALSRTLDRGIADRVERQQETQAVLKGVTNTFGYGKDSKPVNVDFLNKAISRLLIDKAEETGKNLLGSVHSILNNYPVYSSVVDKLRGIYDSSEDLQGLLHTITGEGVDKSKKAKVLAEYAKVAAQRNDFIGENVSDFDAITKELSEEAKSTLEAVIFKVPMYDYFVQAKEVDSVEKLEASIKGLEKDLGKGTKAIEDVDNLVNLNIEDKVTGSIYNLQDYSTDSEHHLKVRRLLALKSIKALGADKVFSLLQNKELSNKLEDLVMANYLSTLQISGKKNLRSSTIPHSYTEGIQQRAITLKELNQYEFGEKTGWVIVEKPTASKLGLVYRKVIDSTSVPGAFTDVKMSTSDIAVIPEMAKFDNVISTPSGYKMITTEENRKTMGSLGAVQSLVRSTAHSLSIQESDIIRDTLLKEETTFSIGKTNKQDLDDILKDKNKENPWFLKAEGITYGDLSPEAKARYKPVGNRVSDVKGFDENVTWVRKDISHWLLGGDRASPFTDPKWKWGLRIVKDLVGMAKVGMVILNPGKIARDNVSNITYLGVMGVSPQFALNSYTEIMQQFGQYTEVKSELMKLKVKAVARPDNLAIKKKVKSLTERLNKNPISSIEDKGFLNSLGSSLISRDSETLGNTERDVNTALTFLLKNSKGKNNYISHFMLQMQKVGFNGEDFLGYLGGMVGKFEAGKEIESELTKIEERLKDIRSDKDVVAYASQFINSPQSQAVRFGANITDLTDVLAKETLYRHLVAEGMKPEQAKIKVLDSFPNYIENMPLAVQQASDVGIIMFPSFWLRIQKVIYRMAKDRPVSLATEEAIDSYLGTNFDSIVDSNIVTKATSWSGILHSPFESAGFAATFPTNALSL